MEKWYVLTNSENVVLGVYGAALRAFAEGARSALVELRGYRPHVGDTLRGGA